MKTYLSCLLFQFIYALTIFIAPGNLFSQWVHTNGPGGAMVYSLAVNGNNIFAGTYGGVYLSTDNGNNWNTAGSGLPERTPIISFAAQNTIIFAGTQNKGIFRSTDNGANWDSVNNGLQQVKDGWVNGLVFKGDTVFAAIYTGNYGKVFLSADSGRSWIDASKGLPEFTFMKALAEGNNRLFAATSDGIYRSTDNALNWIAVTKGIPDKYFTSLYVKGDTIYAGTDFGGRGIYHSADGGDNWRLLQTGLKEATVSAIISSGSYVFAAAYGKGVILSDDGGETWRTAQGNLPDPSINTLAVKDSLIFAGTYYGGIFRSVNNGSEWISFNYGINDLTASSMILKDSTLFAGTAAGVFSTTDNGQTWNLSGRGLDSTSVKSFALSGNYIFAVTGKGIYRSSDNGLFWQKSENGLHASVFKSIAVAGNHIFAGTDSGVFVSIDEGSNWKPSNKGLRTDLDSILHVSRLAVCGNNIIAGASGIPDYGGIYFTADSGKSWNIGLYEYARISIYSLAVSKDKVFAYYTYGKLHHPAIVWSADSGKTWTGIKKGIPPYTDLNMLHVIKDTVYATTNNGTYKFSFDSTAWINADKDFPGELVSSAYNDNYIFAGIKGLGVWRLALPGNPVHVIDKQYKHPFSFSLDQNYPNPFNPITAISYSIPEKLHVEMIIYDVLGRKVLTLINSVQPAGNYKVRLNASFLPSGVYIYSLQAGDFRKSKKLLLLK